MGNSKQFQILMSQANSSAFTIFGTTFATSFTSLKICISTTTEQFDCIKSPDTIAFLFFFFRNIKQPEIGEFSSMEADKKGSRHWPSGFKVGERHILQVRSSVRSSKRARCDSLLPIMSERNGKLENWESFSLRNACCARSTIEFFFFFWLGIIIIIIKKGNQKRFLLLIRDFQKRCVG